jgi:hypothetical protein
MMFYSGDFQPFSHDWTIELSPGFISIKNYCQALVAHACNPSYSGGRGQEDHSSKPAWANSS